ncbi:restriction endonuclease subunit S [Campylobacter helveticus]|nr:restriction endonuclease subunit S [Campylobacter helveticus]
MNNKEIVPKLRFPEFTGKWQNEKLGGLFLSRQETEFSDLTLMSLTDENGLIPQQETKKKDNSNIDKSKYLRVCKGDIVYNTMRMWQGRCAYCKNEGIVSPAYTVCIPKDSCDGVFFYYYFKTYDLIQKFHANSQSLVGDTLNLKFDKFASIVISYPIDKCEQQKIATCLSSIDNLIDAENRKLKVLKKYKKGLMQKLFPAE